VYTGMPLRSGRRGRQRGPCQRRWSGCIWARGAQSRNTGHGGQMTDGDADFRKSPIFHPLRSFPKIVSHVSSVTMGRLRGISRTGPITSWMAKSLHVDLQRAGLVLVGPCLSPDGYLDAPNGALTCTWMRAWGTSGCWR
jgi:hypothetical protein